MTEQPKLSKDLFKKYAELKAVIKEAEDQIKEINPLIRSEMEKNKLDKVGADYGKFYFVEVPVWTFPEEIKKLEIELEAKKAEAKQKGKAKHTMRLDLKYSPKKTTHE